MWAWPFGILGLTSVGFTRALISSAAHSRPWRAGLHLLLALLVVLLGNVCVPQELGVPTPLRDSYRCDWGFLMPFLWHFWDWLCVVWFLGLAMFAPGPCGSRSAWGQKRPRRFFYRPVDLPGDGKPRGVQGCQQRGAQRPTPQGQRKGHMTGACEDRGVGSSGPDTRSEATGKKAEDRCPASGSSRLLPESPLLSFPCLCGGVQAGSRDVSRFV